MTCPRCGAKTRSKTTVCPTCGHRPRRLKWIAVPIVIALIAFVSFLTNAYLTDTPRSSKSLANKVDLNITEDTVSADGATTVDLETLQDSLYTIGTGSGFLISPQDVLTAAHNVAGITRVTLKQGDETMNGTVVGRTDAIAVIRIEKVKTSPFSFSHAIVGPDESVLTLAPDEQIEGTLTFEEDSYRREFDLPNRAVGSPIVTANGRVLGIHLVTKTLPVALFEQDVLSFLKSDTPAPPPTTKRSAPAAELAPVAPITPVPKREDPAEPAPAPEPEPTPEPEPETEAAPETPEPNEPPAEEPAPVEEETPAEPEQPAEEPEAPPVTEQPTEPDVPVTEPAEPVEPEKPAAQEKEAEAPAPVKKQDKPDTKPKADQPDTKPKQDKNDKPAPPPVTEEKPDATDAIEDVPDEPVEDEESTPSE
ncbi:S1 family peptidase [Exiguobacterium aurantiacum]|uniref:Uncharacterized protein n=1 Tax=Exiguobacterium aurantiacum TaxID=33987 RepID=A0ABY5FQ87_9BACL|nr:hypothetical protein [Exiguobacterium aurantiacum]UTT43606.1 hypothetical protein NMQ00_03630 [Exiguobacterium aurantiacum]